MNSGVNLRRAASMAARLMRFMESSEHSFQLVTEPASKPRAGFMIALISLAPRLLVRKMMESEKSTRRLSPRVSVALSSTPSSRFHTASEAFSISSKSTKLTFTRSVWY